MDIKNIFGKIDPKVLSLIGLGCTGLGIVSNLVGDKVTDEQTRRTIEEMIDKKVTERLSKG